MIYFIIWTLICLSIPYFLASDKREIGFFLGFLSCFLLSPLIGIIIILLSKEKKTDIKTNEKSNVSSEIIKLNELHEKGLISKEQLDNQIKKILD